MSKRYSTVDLFVLTFQQIFLPILTLLIFGWKALVIYFVIQKLIYTSLFYIFNLEAIAPLDEFFLLDSKVNRPNIVTVMKLKRFKDVHAVKKMVREQLQSFPRAKHRLVKLFSYYFYKPLSKEALEKASEKSFVIIENDIGAKLDLK